MLEFILLFPVRTAIILEVLLGMIGSIIFSNHVQLNSTVSFQTFTLNLSTFSASFYIPLSLAFILVIYFRNKNDHDKKNLERILELNHRLEGMNKNINQKLFSIQQTSYQQERMRITKEIHDTAGYVFINIIMLLQAALAVFDSDQQLGESKIEDALDYTRRGMNEIRYILREMRMYEKPSLG
jgi:signal transduction histidine kinase